jgi:hypothetical protein
VTFLDQSRNVGFGDAKMDEQGAHARPRNSCYALGAAAAAVATGTAAAFLAEPLAADFFFAQRFFCDSAIFLRLSALITRLAALAGAFFGAASFAAGSGLVAFFAAQRAFCAAAIFLRPAELRVPELSGLLPSREQ